MREPGRRAGDQRQSGGLPSAASSAAALALSAASVAASLRPLDRVRPTDLLADVGGKGPRLLSELAARIGGHLAGPLHERRGLVGGDGDELGGLGRELADGRGGLLGEVLDGVADLVEDLVRLGRRARRGVAGGVLGGLGAVGGRVARVARAFGRFVVAGVQGIGHVVRLLVMGAHPRTNRVRWHGI